jgi:hypothetical protein
MVRSFGPLPALLKPTGRGEAARFMEGGQSRWQHRLATSDEVGMVDERLMCVAAEVLENRPKHAIRWYFCLGGSLCPILDPGVTGILLSFY